MFSDAEKAMTYGTAFAIKKAAIGNVFAVEQGISLKFLQQTDKQTCIERFFGRLEIMGLTA